MNIVLNLILALQMLSAVAMIGLILIQHGKGADMGAAFGSGGAGSLFGASGSANFLSRTTAVLATVYFVCTLALAYFSNARPASRGGLGSVLDTPAATAPASSSSAPAAAPGASQIPGAAQVPGNTPVPASTPAAPATAASGTAQIPGK